VGAAEKYMKAVPTMMNYVIVKVIDDVQSSNEKNGTTRQGEKPMIAQKEKKSTRGAAILSGVGRLGVVVLGSRLSFPRP
jgi:hypothetical protein